VVDAKSTRSITNARVLLGDSSDDTTYRSNGWFSAYEADFQPTAAGDSRQIRILIHQFKDPRGAYSFFAAGIGSQKGEHGMPLVKPPILGQDSSAFVQPLIRKGQTQFWFYWIDRNVMARVLVGGPDRSFTESDATNLAQAQAAIIRQN
jgi:hypothetical protein